VTQVGQRFGRLMASCEQIVHWLRSRKEALVPFICHMHSIVDHNQTAWAPGRAN
jgi:hypothetical protein